MTKHLLTHMATNSFQKWTVFTYYNGGNMENNISRKVPESVTIMQQERHLHHVLMSNFLNLSNILSLRHYFPDYLYFLPMKPVKEEEG